MRNKVAGRLTICEVLRQVNDLYQDDSEYAESVRYLLVESERASKILSKQLFRNHFRMNRKFWKTNPALHASLKRKHKEYKCGRPTDQMRKDSRSVFTVITHTRREVWRDEDRKRKTSATKLLITAYRMAKRMNLKLEEYKSKGLR